MTGFSPTLGGRGARADLFPLISRANAWTLAGILAVALVLGSIWDLQISRDLYDPSSPIGLFGAGFGQSPSAMALVAAGALLLTHPRGQKLQRAACLGFGVIASTGGVLLLMLIPVRFLDRPQAVLVVVGLGVGVAVFWGTSKIARTADPQTAARLAVVLIAVVLAEATILTVLKVVWERPRMYFLVQNPEVHFVPWWKPGYPGMSALLAQGATSWDFRSFPSLHTANAATALLLTALPALRPSWQRLATALFWIGATWALFIGFTRIVMGAHFLSDTVVGLGITFLVVLVAYRLAYPKPSDAPAAVAPNESRS